MAKTLKYSLIVMAVLGMIVLGAGAALAQDSTAQGAADQGVGPGHPAEDPGARAETMQSWDHYMRQNPELRQQIMKDPSLLNNPDFLAKHPELQKFETQHPDFTKAVQKNPERMMHKAAHQEKRAAARHAQRNQNGRPAKQ
jgi:hypothetical protein